MRACDGFGADASKTKTNGNDSNYRRPAGARVRVVIAQPRASDLDGRLVHPVLRARVR